MKEEMDFVEVVERCNLKTGVNTVFSGGEVLHSSTLSNDEIYEKYKDYLTKDQIRDLYKRYNLCGFNNICYMGGGIDLGMSDSGQYLTEVLELMLEDLFKGEVELECVNPTSNELSGKVVDSLSNCNHTGYMGGIDPYKSDSTDYKVGVFNCSRH